LSRWTFDCRIGMAVALLVASTPGAFAQSASHPAKDSSPTGGAEVWDANHDGIYTCDEWKSYLGRLFNLADHNHDGYLDKTEFATIRKAGSTFGDADFGYFDENQDGKISRDEFVDQPNEFILSHDKNGDCRVTPDELKDAGSDQKGQGIKPKKL
jgi:hypothetical protein